jgi:CheY-like chemotaxis protein
MRNAPILLIDPSAATRSMYADCFRHHGHDVVEAEDAEDGLRLFARCEPALVVTEVYDDPVWIDAIRMMAVLVPGQHTPTILCSTQIDPFRPTPPAGVHADMVLAKPVSPRHLLMQASTLLGSDGGTAAPALPRAATSAA